MSVTSVGFLQFGQVAKADKQRFRHEVWGTWRMPLDRSAVREYADDIDNPLRREMDSIAFLYTENEPAAKLEADLVSVARRLGMRKSPTLIKVYIRQLIDDSFKIPEGSPVIQAFIDAYKTAVGRGEEQERESFRLEF